MNFDSDLNDTQWQHIYKNDPANVSYLYILLEITYRILPEPKIYMKSTMNGHSPFTVDFKEMTQESSEI